MDTNSIDNYIKIRMGKEKIPGVSLGIVKDNKIIYLKGYGKANEKGDLVTEKTPFILGSVSKSFTALAIMQLYESGKLDIDKPVKQYLPWFQVKDKEATEKITIRNLLTHTSGLSNMTNYDELIKDDIPLEEFVKKLKDTNITKPVNATFQYSNIGYSILGEVIQKVSGVSYSEYIEKNVFLPLQMNNSYTSQDEAKKNGLATGYFSSFMFKIPINQREHIASIPCGYIISSAEDMCHYLIANLNSGIYNKQPVISESLLEKMHSKIVYFGRGNYYGMGWVSDSDYVWHNGESENFWSDLFIDKTKKIGVVMLFNTSDNLASYDYIARGVMNIAEGNKQDNYIRSSLRPIMNILLVIFFVLSIVELVSLVRWVKDFEFIDIQVQAEVVKVIFINFIIPIAVYILGVRGVCNLFNGPAKWMPDVIATVMVLPIALLISGLVKIFMLIKH
ncbi:penicillin-binding protein [Clostridium zeae]|uniref:Penicillin-binding protein n=1 Tax=Clostridium zeae TaxID=2759022 RepID=A0ABQ1E747_9CLOT|nr:serine hydrolase domain-containing protein [Clostridium zeae]GFZ30333.1 penicillin-binding protein [Clostridium zeae]